METGIKVFNYIKSKGISQTFISEKSGIPVSKLNLSLHGKRRLTFSEYEKICWALGVSVDTFLEPRPPVSCPTDGN